MTSNNNDIKIESWNSIWIYILISSSKLHPNFISTWAKSYFQFTSLCKTYFPLEEMQKLKLHRNYIKSFLSQRQPTTKHTSNLKIKYLISLTPVSSPQPQSLSKFKIHKTPKSKNKATNPKLAKPQFHFHNHKPSKFKIKPKHTTPNRENRH